MKTTSQNLLADKYRLLSKALNGKFDASGEKELIEKGVKVTEQQFKDVVKGASKTGITLIVQPTINEAVAEQRKVTNKNK